MLARLQPGGSVGGDAVLIPNGVATERYAMADPLPGWSGRTERAYGADGGALGFLGRMDEPRKGLQVLLRAWPEIRALS